MRVDSDRHRTADLAVRLLTAGFTDGQARVIVEITGESVERAKADLRRDFALWYAYWAIYVFAQVSIALLALMLTYSIGEPSETGTLRSAIDPSSFKLRTE